MRYIAHKAEDGREQSVLEHLQNVSVLAGEFASSFGESKSGQEIGLYHDIGKYSVGFQNRILNNGIKVDHSTAGAKEMIKAKNPVAAFCIAGHHSGLMNMGTKFSVDGDGTLCGRLKKSLSGELNYDYFKNELSAPSFSDQNDKNKCSSKFEQSFLTRMLFSSLVDADFLDTERFMTNGAVQRGSSITVQELKKKFDRYCQKFQGCVGDINVKRQEIREECIAKAKEEPGLFSLTVPTGGGKTLSSLAFALYHAVEYGKERIIYVIPYTSIIEQTADIFRDILGDENVIEHHMNVDYEDKEEFANNKESLKKLATENWDASVIVTTNVQFFESLFSNKVSHCRKLHNVANSVVIFDEAQMLPVDYLKPCIEAIKVLACHYGVTEVLCTATQPSLNKFVEPCEIREICSNTEELYKFFHRVQYKCLKLSSLDEVATEMNKHEQVLCVTNSKKDAQKIYNMMTGEGSYHLSTFMYPNHRRTVLETIKKRLKSGLPCKVVSTSLIEAGVDVDFPVVFREIAGLDSCIQAGGRCNREGKHCVEDSVVHLYDLDKPVAKIPNYIRQPQSITKGLLGEYEDIAGLAAIKSYFDKLHYFKGDDALDKKDILGELEKYNFAEVGKKFRLIEEETRAIFIDNNDESHKILIQLKLGIWNRGLMRKAGMYIVSVYERQYEQLLKLGKIEVIDDDLAILTDESVYDKHVGLNINMDDGNAIML